MLNQDDIINFLRSNGGRVTNTDLYLAFKNHIVTPEDKKVFPQLVNKVAFVKKKVENGSEIKYTYLRKAFKEATITPRDDKSTESKENISQEDDLLQKIEKARKESQIIKARQEIDVPSQVSDSFKSPTPPPQSDLIRERSLQKPSPVDPRLERHKKAIAQQMRAISSESINSAHSKSSANSRESRENTPKRESQPIRQSDSQKPSFKKPSIPASSKRPILGQNNNSNIKNSELSGSTDSLKSAESTASRDRSRLDSTDKQWIQAIMNNDQAKVKKMLDERVEWLEYRDYILGYTGAHWAVKMNNVQILKMLIHAGIDLNVTSHNGSTLLHLAIQSGHYGIVKELTSYRRMSKLLCDREARDNAGKLPRHYIDSDKFEPEEIAYMKRIIEPPRTGALGIVEENSFSDRRDSSNKNSNHGKSLSSMFRSVRGSMFDKKSKHQKRTDLSYAPNQPSPNRGWNNL